MSATLAARFGWHCLDYQHAYVIINELISAAGGVGGVNLAKAGPAAWARPRTRPAVPAAASAAKSLRGGGGRAGGSISISSGSTKGTLNPITVPITLGELLAAGAQRLTAELPETAAWAIGEAGGGAGGSLNNGARGGPRWLSSHHRERQHQHSFRLGTPGCGGELTGKGGQGAMVSRARRRRHRGQRLQAASAGS